MSECKMKAPTHTIVCIDNCNKCFASETSRLLYHTILGKLNKRDEKKKRTEYKPGFMKFKINNTSTAATSSFKRKNTESPLLFENVDNNKPTADVIAPSPSKKLRRQSNSYLPKNPQHQPTKTEKNISTVTTKFKCKRKNAAMNAGRLHAKTQVQNHGHYYNDELKALDRHLDLALNSHEACRAFQILK
ncbi:Hypothetical predicted protein [Paramuricea clavata]|uniref:Uncharacterized protein n=1 Tax=Paramuricea clavata TaxID=317549 RepID=A0A7D9L7R6_PARCT|nr:Hypothetical predicted protein [Paramuricea clavata]